MWNRGGFGEKGAIDRFNAKGIFGQIASWGYVVFASQYRGNAGGDGKEKLGGDDVNDILNLMDLAGEISFADNRNWGMEGWSRGGMMTFLALRKRKDVKCAVLIGAISNLKQIADDNPKMKEKYKGLIDAENPEEELVK
jgi:pimeloyl-ACP methyl ester carboxylesterase